MSAFRDQLAVDVVETFLDPEFFGESHSIGLDGKTVTCVIEQDTKADGGEAARMGIASSTCTLYARESDIPRQKQGSQLVIDNVIYTVVDWRLDEGMHRVSLKSPTASVGVI